MVYAMLFLRVVDFAWGLKKGILLNNKYNGNITSSTRVLCFHYLHTCYLIYRYFQKMPLTLIKGLIGVYVYANTDKGIITSY